MSEQRNKGRARIKKYAVLTAMFAMFGLSMWLIFTPSKEEQAKREQGKGFNTDIPDPKTTGIVDDKKEAYEQERQRVKQRERMQSLREYAVHLDDSLPQAPKPSLVGPEPTAQERAGYERQARMAPKPTVYVQDAPGYKNTDAYKRQNSFETSKSAYQDINRTLGNFYEQPRDKEKEEMKARLEQLEAAISGGGQSNPYDDQMALMEKSYEMAAKYMGGGQGKPAAAPAKPKATPVEQVARHVVTALAQPMSDREFIDGFARPRNAGFNTATVEAGSVGRNTIGAVVHNGQTLTDGQSVRLRLTEPLRAGTLLVPVNTIVTGFAKVAGERLEITVSSIGHGGRIVPVELTAYDTDGQRGIHIPGSMEIDAAKQIAANAGGDMGSSISLTQQGAGQQLATDLGRGVIRGTSAYLSGKVGQVKVTLKAGYRIMLLPGEN